MLEASGIAKSFFGKKALNGLHFTLRPGEVHCLVGENGAGKSTFVKILSGVFKDYEGQISIDGHATRLDSPRVSRSLGIAAIQQSRDLVPTLSIVDNLFLGIEREGTGRILRRDEMIREARSILSLFRESMDYYALIRNLEVEDQEIVAIGKALLMNCRYLLMDETTAPLGGHDQETLFDLIRKLKSKGIGILYISHNLKELYQIGDRVTVVRDGENVYTGVIPDNDRLIGLMIGKDPAKLQDTARTHLRAAAPVLQLSGVSLRDQLREVNLRVHAGEIVGIYGLEGRDLHVLGETIFGLHPKSTGTVLVHGKIIRNSVRTRMRSGIGYVPNNRALKGLMLIRSIGENLNLVRLAENGSVHVSRRSIQQISEEGISKFRIKAVSHLQEVRFLSGGNQQKVMLAKWLAAKRSILVLDEPTEGVDVGVRLEIHSLLRGMSRDGTGIVLISTDLDQLLVLCHRVVVMSRGKLKRDYDLAARQVQKNEILEEALFTA